MNFTASAFYKLDEGTGATVADALGKAPDLSVIGTTTDIWANADCFTISKPAGAAGDNALKAVDAYFDAMLRLDDLDGSSILLAYQINQPQVPSSGARIVMSYGDFGNTTDGGWGVYDSNHIPTWSLRSGGTWQQNGHTVIEPLTAAENGVWTSLAVQLDLFDGRLVATGYINDYPNRGCRLFSAEASLPRADTTGAGFRLFGKGSSGGGSANFLWGQTQLRRVFIGRTNGDQRHNVPKWVKSLSDASGGIPSFMTE